MNMRNGFGKVGIGNKVAMLLILLVGAAVLIGVGFADIGVRSVSAAFTPASSLVYNEYDINGTELVIKPASGENRELGYITNDALYGTYGELVCNPPNSLTEIYFEVKFAPAVESGELVFGHIGDAEGEIDVSHEGNNILWYYGGVGVYKVIVYVMVDEVPETEEEPEPAEEPDPSEEEPEEVPDMYEYLFVCKSGTADLAARFKTSGKNTYTNYTDFSGRVELTPLAGQNYQLPNETQFVISNVLSPFEYEFSDDGIVLIIKKNTKAGEHAVTFNITYKCLEIDDFGIITALTEQTDTVTAVLNLKKRPNDDSLLTALLGLTVLGILGGAVYGITYMSKRMQEKQDTVRMK